MVPAWGAGHHDPAFTLGRGDDPHADASPPADDIMKETDSPSRSARKPRRRLRRLALVVLLTYGGICMLVTWFQSKLIYFPSRPYHATPADIGLEFQEVSIQTSDGVAIAAWYLAHPRAKGTILFCHGNAGNISDRLVSIELLHTLGYNVLIFDYRGYGRSEGRPTETGTYLDAQAAWRYLTEDRRLPADRVVLFGRSLGGAVAIELAGHHSPAALIVESTFTSLTDVAAIHYPLLPVRWLLRFRYDSIDKIAALNCPKLFFHGTDDELIPMANGRALFEKAAPPKRFIATPGGHNDAGFTYSLEHTHQLAAFLDEVWSDGVR